jgi:hypothetical protein
VIFTEHPEICDGNFLAGKRLGLRRKIFCRKLGPHSMLGYKTPAEVAEELRNLIFF